ncbi:pyridoxamine 5'-phosphate oxidase family protein [Streptomyces griseoincarnatus]
MTDVPDTPAGRLDPRYSDPTAGAPPWTEVERLIAEAELFWISTVRPDGRPHVTPLPAVWSSGALHFCTGPEERKARNLAENPHVVFTTGVNTWARGYDVVVEGRAERVRDDARLRGLAALWEEKYGDFWHFDVRDGHFHHGPGRALVFSVAPHTVFGFVDALPA